MQENIIFGERIKDLRKAAGLTQSRFSELLNIHLQTVSKWERGISEPDISQLGAIAEALDTTPEALLGLPDPPERLTGCFSAERFGKCLAELRHRAREEQKVTASLFYVSVDTISKWERGIACPNIEKLPVLADHYGVSVSELYFGAFAEGREPKSPEPRREAPPAPESPAQGHKKARPAHSRHRLLFSVFYVAVFVLAFCITVISAFAPPLFTGPARTTGAFMRSGRVGHDRTGYRPCRRLQVDMLYRLRQTASGRKRSRNRARVHHIHRSAHLRKEWVR